MKRILTLLILVICIRGLQACTNKKQAIVEQIKTAKKEYLKAKSKEDAFDYVLFNGDSSVHKRIPLDTLIQQASQASVSKKYWQEVIDSLELELKKY